MRGRGYENPREITGQLASLVCVAPNETISNKLGSTPQAILMHASCACACVRACVCAHARLKLLKKSVSCQLVSDSLYVHFVQDAHGLSNVGPID